MKKIIDNKMKKIINGKMYNTETATFVCNYWNGLSYFDFRYVTEDLYRKKTGEYFIKYNGGALSKYAESYGDGRCEGAGIKPVSREFAMRFVNRNATPEVYIKEFGEVEE